MAGFITSKVEMTHLIISLRAQYKIWMQIHLEKPCDLSIERTVSGAIQEVCMCTASMCCAVIISDP